MRVLIQLGEYYFSLITVSREYDVNFLIRFNTNNYVTFLIRFNTNNYEKKMSTPQKAQPA